MLRRADPAAGAADDLRQQRVLAPAGAPSSTTPSTRPTPAQGVWRRFGDKVLQRPALALCVTVAVFVAGALGLLAYKVDYSTTTLLQEVRRQRRGLRGARGGVPAGNAGADDACWSRNENGPVTEAQVSEAVAERRVGGRRRQRRRRPASPRPTASTASVEIVLEDDPLEVVLARDRPRAARCRRRSRRRASTGLVGGTTAINYDFDKATKSDLRLIAPIALLRDRDHPRDPAARRWWRRWS